MIWSDVIYWFIGSTCVLTLTAALRNGGLRSLWLWESLGMLGLCVFAATTGSLQGLTIFAWVVLFLTPILGFSYLQQQVAAGKYGISISVAVALSYFHPGDGWKDYPDILRALMLVQEGRADVALAVLKRFRNSLEPMALHATITAFRLERRWQECIDWIDTLPPPQWTKNPSLVAAYVRSLGELQQYTRLFELVEAQWEQFTRQPKAFSQALLIALAYGGQMQGLQRFFAQPHNRFQAETQTYWMATAAMTSGRLSVAQAQLEQLRRQTQDEGLRQAITNRLRSPLKPSQPFISEDLQTQLHQFEQVHVSSSRYDFGQRHTGKFWLTWTLLAANLVMFGLEVMRGGSQSSEVLYSLGGLWPPAVWAGEYWRLISANFLHSGTMHLAMNMMGLLILGPFLERVLGVLRYFLIYSASGLGAALCIAFLPLWLGTEPEFTVGASGAIMGLVGAIAAVTLWGWLVDRVAIAAKRFRTVLLMIGLQIAFDFSTPQISRTGHLSGMAVGFLVTLIVIALFGFKKSAPSASRRLTA
ncbi:MAG: rhomboid family intramembrane serine protease [Cyanobacteria bacterium P01_F01_bin.42]